jgi:hypothetical protein
MVKRRVDRMTREVSVRRPLTACTPSSVTATQPARVRDVSAGRLLIVLLLYPDG